MFRIIFVLDLYNINVVHAQGGDRKNYRPVHLTSHICTTSEPIKLIEEINPKEVYLVAYSYFFIIPVYELGSRLYRFPPSLLRPRLRTGKARE